jgi:hypothetical protein
MNLYLLAHQTLVTQLQLQLLLLLLLLLLRSESWESIVDVMICVLNKTNQNGKPPVLLCTYCEYYRMFQKISGQVGVWRNLKNPGVNVFITTIVSNELL